MLFLKFPISPLSSTFPLYPNQLACNVSVLSHLHGMQDTVFPHWAYEVLGHHGGVLLGPGRDADWRKKTGRRRWIVNKEDLAAEDRKRIAMVWWAPAPGPDHRARYTVIPPHCWHTPVLLILLGREGELLLGPLSPPVSVVSILAVTGMARECLASVHLRTYWVFPPRASRHFSVASLVVMPTEERRLVEEDGS